ncbi:hypothetical protein [Eubacterium xylanophilum]|uniref:hypothetical protein n=1 Tax=Eubacterium xylanophilum TaxID=39497 RepID=UPI0004794D18|nr:hypothetical protein [Eubacterium xylanophilum]
MNKQQKKAKVSLRRRIKEMPLSKKIQLCAASLVTLGILVMIPILAWFANQRKLAELEAIKSPDLLYITSANVEAVKNIDMSGIDVEATKSVNGVETPITNKLFPFCVAGEYVSKFTLQLAHTTNNPFKYEVYEGKVFTSEDDAIQYAANKNTEYVTYTVTCNLDGIVIPGLTRTSVTKGEKLYIVKGSSLQSGSADNTGGYQGAYLNKSGDGRTASDKYHEESYGNEGGTYDILKNYEEALYWQCRDIQSVDNLLDHDEAFFRTFIIDVSWDGVTISNNKETDIVYIMAYSGAQ